MNEQPGAAYAGIAALLIVPVATGILTYIELTREPSAMWPDAGKVGPALWLMWAVSAACVLTMIFVGWMIWQAFKPGPPLELPSPARRTDAQPMTPATRRPGVVDEY